MAKKKTDYQQQVRDLRKVLWEVYISKDIASGLRRMVQLALEDEFVPAVGDAVNYHSVIGGAITQSNMKVRTIAMLDDARIVVWLEGKAGFVELKSVSRYEE